MQVRILPSYELGNIPQLPARWGIFPNRKKFHFFTEKLDTSPHFTYSPFITLTLRMTMTIETLAQLNSEEQAILNGWFDERAMTAEEVDQMAEEMGEN